MQAHQADCLLVEAEVLLQALRGDEEAKATAARALATARSLFERSLGGTGPHVELAADDTSAYNLACVCALQHQLCDSAKTDAALDAARMWLSRAVRAGSVDGDELVQEYAFAPFRSEPWFVQLLERANR